MSGNKRKLAVPKPHQLSRLSLYALKPEEALAAFMQIDPAKVKAGIRRMRQDRAKRPALPTG